MSDRSRITWDCRRGMKELDVLLEGYLRRHYESAPCAEQALFKQLLQMQDPELYRYLTAREDPQDPALLALIERIRNCLHAPR